jgi:hypothetical protein
MRKIMLVFCADSSHTTDPVGLFITNPDPLAFLPDDVYIGREFYQNPSRDPHWRIRRYGRHQLGVPRRTPVWEEESPTAPVGFGIDGQTRRLLPEGTVLPPFARMTQAERLSSFGTRESFSPVCRARTSAGRRCGQRGGRWKVEDLDEVFSQLNQRGITGVSMRALDLIKHSGIRSV